MHFSKITKLKKKKTLIYVTAAGNRKNEKNKIKKYIAHLDLKIVTKKKALKKKNPPTLIESISSMSIQFLNKILEITMRK